MYLLLHLTLLLLLKQGVCDSTKAVQYRLLAKSPLPDCSSPSASSEVTSDLAAEIGPSSQDARAICAFACSLAKCFAFYLTKLSDCRLVRLDALIKTWLNTALCPEAVFAEPLLALETKINLTNCQQSSELWGGACTPDFDGVTNQNFLAGYCSHTSETTNQWWETDLSPGYFITKVQIFNRQDCCPERLNELTISVDGVACVNFATSVPFSISNFTCGRFGSVVRIQTPLSHGLAMCEVYIFGMKAA